MVDLRAELLGKRKAPLGGANLFENPSPRISRCVSKEGFCFGIYNTTTIDFDGVISQKNSAAYVKIRKKCEYVSENC